MERKMDMASKFGPTGLVMRDIGFKIVHVAKANSITWMVILTMGTGKMIQQMVMVNIFTQTEILTEGTG